jgi:6-pyruvoyltetrahydropterin/6-carboxytetrahydropterin synthase
VDPECAFVVDFGVLKRMVRPLVQAVDHRMLLPTENPKLVLREQGERLFVEYLGQQRFEFPRSNCALLPLSNTTAEMLAEYFARRIRAELEQEGLRHLESLEVEIEESPGQSGWFSVGLARSD